MEYKEFTVSELIEKLKGFPQDMKVCYDYDGGYSTGAVTSVIVDNEWYNDDHGKVVILV